MYWASDDEHPVVLSDCETQRNLCDVTTEEGNAYRPTRALIAYMAFWGLFTATLRPLAGEGIWELVERSYNYGVRAALLLLYGIRDAPKPPW
jgi:hypothetical protein